MPPVRLRGLLLGALAAGLPAADAGGQEPGAAEAPRGRAAYEAPRLAFSLTFGTFDPGELQSQGVLAERLNAGTGAPTDAEPLVRSLAVEDGFQVGGSALLGLSPAWAVRAGVVVGRGTLAAGYEGAEEWTDAVRRLAPGAPAGLSYLSAEAAVRFRMRSGRRLQPYAELGAAGVRMDAEDPAFPGAADLTGETTMAGLVGLGAIVPVVGRVAGRVQATAHLFGTPATAAEGAAAVPADTLRVTFTTPATGPFGDRARELIRSVRLDLGVSIELGSARRPRGAPAARPSAPRP